jgi:hypothetical protein
MLINIFMTVYIVKRAGGFAYRAWQGLFVFFCFKKTFLTENNLSTKRMFNRCLLVTEKALRYHKLMDGTSLPTTIINLGYFLYLVSIKSSYSVSKEIHVEKIQHFFTQKEVYCSFSKHRETCKDQDNFINFFWNAEIQEGNQKA